MFDDFAPYARSEGMVAPTVTSGTPWQVTVTGYHGYAVFPAKFLYKQKGKPVTESGIWPGPDIEKARRCGPARLGDLTNGRHESDEHDEADLGNPGGSGLFQRRLPWRNRVSTAAG